jgi:hypothetical protein
VNTVAVLFWPAGSTLLKFRKETVGVKTGLHISSSWKYNLAYVAIKNTLFDTDNLTGSIRKNI